MVASGWTPTQQTVIAIIPKFSAGASLIGSSCIIYEVLFFDRRKLGRVYHRLLLTMSIYDVIESTWNFASTWPIPRGTEGVAFASGTTLTCTIQGFILEFGLAIPILNMCLSIYYLLVIKYSWTEAEIKRRVEKWFHGVALGVALGFSSACVALDLFNNANLWCWIAPLPLDCLDSFRHGAEGNCIRGDNAWIYRWAFYYAELWFCILFVMFAMLAVYFEVRRLEKANDKYEFRARRQSTVRKKPSKSRQVAKQALWYVGAFYLTFLFATINRVIQQVVGKTFFAMTVLHTIFEPSQGFLNYLVYIRPRYVKYREKNESVSRLQALRHVMFPNEEEARARTESVFVDDGHEDEELARSELKRWRLRSLRASVRISSKRVSGVMRFLSSENFGDHSCTTQDGLTDDTVRGSEDGNEVVTPSQDELQLEEPDEFLSGDEENAVLPKLNDQQVEAEASKPLEKENLDDGKEENHKINKSVAFQL